MTRVRVYCGNYVGESRGLHDEPDECNAEAVVDVHPDEIDFATYTCPGCGAVNAVRDHEQHDGEEAA